MQDNWPADNYRELLSIAIYNMPNLIKNGGKYRELFLIPI